MRAYKFKKLKRIHGVHFTPDGARLVAVGGMEVRMVDSAVWLDLATGENVGRADQFCQCYAVSPDASRVCFGGASNWSGGLAQVQWATGPNGAWHTFAWSHRSKPPKYDNVAGLAYSACGTRLAVAHSRPRRSGGVYTRALRLTVVAADTGEPLVELPGGFEASVMSFSADGARLAATGGVDGDTDVRVYDLAEKRECLSFAPPGTVTRGVRFLPDGRLAVVNGRNVYVLTADGGTQFTLSGHPKQVNAVAVTPDGSKLLTASHDGSIRAWDAATGEPGTAFDWKIGAVTALAFSPDGLTCAAAGLSGNVVVWDADAG
jgi:DNA-binding beta-propeller fold protein YncE